MLQFLVRELVMLRAIRLQDCGAFQCRVESTWDKQSKTCYQQDSASNFADYGMECCYLLSYASNEEAQSQAEKQVGED